MMKKEKNISGAENESGAAEKSGLNVKWILFILLAVLVILRISNIMSITPEYDEIWSLRNYVRLPVSEIVRDVATPNNHVLNTLGMKLSISLWGMSLFSMRFFSLASFVLLGGLLLFSAGHFLKNKYLQYAAVLVILLDGMLLHYAEVARGYAMQTFFVTGVFFALLFASEESSSARQRLWSNIAFLVCSIGACLTISSGILFVTIIAFVWKGMTFPWKSPWQELWEKEKSFIFCGIIFCLFVLWFYVGNVQAFAQGRASFGEVFTGAGRFLAYCGEILTDSTLLYPLILTIPGIFFLKGFPRKMAVCGSGSMILLLLSALVTKGGPVRIYLPLLPMLYFCAFTVISAMLEKLPRRQKECSLIFAVLCVGVSVYCSEGRRLYFSDADLGEGFMNLSKNIPQDILVAYRPTDAYVVANVHGVDGRKDFAARLGNVPKGVILVHDKAVTGMRFPDFGTKSFPVEAKAANETMCARALPCYYYPLKRFQDGKEDLKRKIVFCIVRGPIAELRTKENYLKKHFISINGFLNPVRGMAPCYLFAADGKDLSASELFAWDRSHGGLTECYILDQR